jgi:hypothetical protein
VARRVWVSDGALSCAKAGTMAQKAAAAIIK